MAKDFWIDGRLGGPVESSLRPARYRGWRAAGRGRCQPAASGGPRGAVFGCARPATLAGGGRVRLRDVSAHPRFRLGPAKDRPGARLGGANPARGRTSSLPDDGRLGGRAGRRRGRLRARLDPGGDRVRLHVAGGHSWERRHWGSPALAWCTPVALSPSMVYRLFPPVFGRRRALRVICAMPCSEAVAIHAGEPANPVAPRHRGPSTIFSSGRGPWRPARHRREPLLGKRLKVAIQAEERQRPSKARPAKPARSNREREPESGPQRPGAFGSAPFRAQEGLCERGGVTDAIRPHSPEPVTLTCRERPACAGRSQRKAPLRSSQGRPGFLGSSCETARYRSLLRAGLRPSARDSGVFE